MIRIVIAVIIVLISGLSYLFLSAENPITGEEQRVSLTTAEEIALGLRAAPQLIQQHGGEAPDPTAQRLVDQVGGQLVGAMKTLHAIDTEVYPFEFTVLDDPQTINAFALPGGQIFITTAMLQELQTEAQLAAVLAHEIGHVVHRHGAEQLAKAQLTQGLAGAAVIASGDVTSGQLAAAIGQLVNMKYGRDDELESDRYGLIVLNHAGYEPQAMIELLQILADQSRGNAPPEFFSTHPNPDNRIAKIEAEIEKLRDAG